MLTERDVWRLTKYVNADNAKIKRKVEKCLPRKTTGDHGYPSTPHHFNENGRAVFTSRQLEWGLPEHFGWEGEYEVQDLGLDYAMNWQDECIHRPRAIHHYSRIDRFKFTLGQLLGCNGDVPPEVLALMPAALQYVSRSEIWVTVRQILKRAGLRLYYNRIPAILAKLGLVRFSGQDKYQAIMADFIKMHNVFSAIKKQMHRVYFPNLRYVAVRLIAKHNLVLPYEIPPTLTPAKTISLSRDFDKIWEFIHEREEEEDTQRLVADIEAFFRE